MPRPPRPPLNPCRPPTLREIVASGKPDARCRSRGKAVSRAGPGSGDFSAKQRKRHLRAAGSLAVAAKGAPRGHELLWRKTLFGCAQKQSGRRRAVLGGGHRSSHLHGWGGRPGRVGVGARAGWRALSAVRALRFLKRLEACSRLEWLGFRDGRQGQERCCAVYRRFGA
jgi:hypothetical protein